MKLHLPYLCMQRGISNEIIPSTFDYFHTRSPGCAKLNPTGNGATVTYCAFGYICYNNLRYHRLRTIFGKAACNML